MASDGITRTLKTYNDTAGQLRKTRCWTAMHQLLAGQAFCAKRSVTGTSSDKSSLNTLHSQEEEKEEQ